MFLFVTLWLWFFFSFSFSFLFLNSVVFTILFLWCLFVIVSFRSSCHWNIIYVLIFSANCTQVCVFFSLNNNLKLDMVLHLVWQATEHAVKSTCFMTTHTLWIWFGLSFGFFLYTILAYDHLRRTHHRRPIQCLCIIINKGSVCWSRCVWLWSRTTTVRNTAICVRKKNVLNQWEERNRAQILKVKIHVGSFMALNGKIGGSIFLLLLLLSLVFPWLSMNASLFCDNLRRCWGAGVDCHCDLQLLFTWHEAWRKF